MTWETRAHFYSLVSNSNTHSSLKSFHICPCLELTALENSPFMCLGLTQNPCWNLITNVIVFGGNEVMRVRPTWMGLVSLEEEASEAAWPLLVKWRPDKKPAFCSPEEDPLQNLT